MLCIFIQFRKKLVFSMVTAICKFGITYILPNNSWILWCFHSAKPVFYSVHAQCMQCHVSTPIGAGACGQSSTARAGVWCAFRSAFPGVPPPPPPPPGAGKTGRLSGGSPCVTTHSLLRLPTKHRHARRLTQVRHKFNACSTHCVFHVFPKVFHTLSGDVHLVFAAFDAIL